MCYTFGMSRKRDGRKAVNIWLPASLLESIETRIPELAPDRTAVIELILSRYWDRPVVEVKDRKAHV